MKQIQHEILLHNSRFCCATRQIKYNIRCGMLQLLFTWTWCFNMRRGEKSREAAKKPTTTQMTGQIIVASKNKKKTGSFLFCFFKLPLKLLSQRVVKLLSNKKMLVDFPKKPITEQKKMQFRIKVNVFWDVKSSAFPAIGQK